MADYYASCAIPKPVSKKKTKKSNGYKNKASRYCYYCGTAYAERHEVFAGSNRQISIDEGFQVDLCHACHEEIQNNITDRAHERNEFWKTKYQSEYEEKLIDAGVDPEKARGLWIALIGRSYI